MPWKVADVLGERLKFIATLKEGNESMAELCRQFGISRKTGYKIKTRFDTEGLAGLYDRPRARHTNPNAVSQEAIARLLDLRSAHRTWGPRKLRAWLVRNYPQETWPASSTIGQILKRNGLIPERRRRRGPPEPGFGDLTQENEPNKVWCADFKGWFNTADGLKCTPFTLIDAYSRYLLGCQALLRTRGSEVKPLFLAAFREYGLPLVIRTDNGPPFANQRSLSGLTPLSVWWLKLGVIPEFIARGHPEQNGRLERFHRTLEEDLTCRPESDLPCQQEALELYRAEYNLERPHEALDYSTPAEFYETSSREYRGEAEEFEYPEAMEVRRVRPQGCIKWCGKHLFVGEGLAGELVGMLPLDDRYWALYVGVLPVAVYDGKREDWASHWRKLGSAPKKEISPEKCNL